MGCSIPKMISKIYFHTGNVLKSNDLMQKAGKHATEEVIACLNMYLSKCTSPFALNEKTVHLKCEEYYKKNDCIEESSTLRTNVKIFLTTNGVEILKDSLKNLFKELNEEVDSLILSFNHDKDTLLADVLILWAVLEEYVNKQKITRIGVSDIETDLFISLYNNSVIKPSIIQINLNSCCVVPEALQKFTEDNEIQILTHSDPNEILPQSCLAKVFGDQTKLDQKIPKLEWMIRYISHVEFRGVLASKGYIVCLKT